MGNLLLDERPLIVLPSLVTRVGLTRAVILQQVHWLLSQPQNGKTIDGYKWVWGDYDLWCRLYFPFWSRRSLQRHILRLEEEGFLISAQHNALNWDRTKYYRLNYEKLNADLPPSTSQGESDDTSTAAARDGSGSFDGVGHRSASPQQSAPSAHARHNADDLAAAAAGADDHAACHPIGRVVVLDGDELDFDTSVLGVHDCILGLMRGRLHVRRNDGLDWQPVPTDDPLYEVYIDWLAFGGNPVSDAPAPSTPAAAVGMEAPSTAGGTNDGHLFSPSNLPDVAQLNVAPVAPSMATPVAPSIATPVAPSIATPVAPSIATPVALSIVPEVALSIVPQVAHSSIPTKTSTETSVREDQAERSTHKQLAEMRAAAQHGGAQGPDRPQVARRKLKVDDLHPSIRAYWDLHQKLPSHAQMQIILEAEIADQVLWRKCLYRWAARGYNPLRIDGPLEWYRMPELMEDRPQPKHPPASPPKPKGVIEVDWPAELVALFKN